MIATIMCLLFSFALAVWIGGEMGKAYKKEYMENK